MADHDDLDPELTPLDPDEAGVDEQQTGASRTEGAHLLANEARPRLEPQGFHYPQVLAWAETYVATQGSGDVDAFVRWVADQESATDRPG